MCKRVNEDENVYEPTSGGVFDIHLLSQLHSAYGRSAHDLTPTSVEY
jgi:hypothetical protein